MKMIVHATHAQGADQYHHARLRQAVHAEQQNERRAEEAAKAVAQVNAAASSSAGQNLNAKA